MKKRIVATLLAFCLVLGLLPGTARASENNTLRSAANVWDGTVADSYAGGSGTEDDPYQISTGAQLAKIANDDGHDNYILTNDIFLNNTEKDDWYKDERLVNKWLSGNVNSFDGQGHTIYGLYGNGLFGIAGTVKNVAVKESYVFDGGVRIQGVGMAIGAIAARAGYVSCCSNTGTVRCDSPNSYAGGIVGYADGIDQCYNSGTITATSGGIDTVSQGSAGGIAAIGYRVSNCYNVEDIYTQSSSADASAYTLFGFAGGIIGNVMTYGACDIKACYNTGRLYPTLKWYHGDIVGITMSGGNNTLTYCYGPYRLSGVATSSYYGKFKSVSSNVLEISEMKSRASFEGFDFDTIWDIDEKINNGYPFLRNCQYEIPDRPVIPGPDDSPSKEITFRVETGKDFTVRVGEQLSITANFSAIEGTSEQVIMWFTDNPDIADIERIGAGSIGPEITGSSAWVKGISPGTANISVALPDGRTASVEVQVVSSSNITPDTFNLDIYRADLLTDRPDMPYSDILFNLLRERSPSRIFMEELYSDWSLLNAVNAWEAVCNTLDTVGKPSNVHKLAFKEKDFYTAILLDILEVNVSNSQANSMESFANTAKSWITEATNFVKLKFDIKDYGSFTKEDKENIAKAYMEYFHKELKFDTWDTNHSFWGYMDMVFKYYTPIMDSAHDLESFAERIVSAYSLVAMSESTKNVVREMYANCPDEISLKLALFDIIKYMDSTETELLLELVNGGFTVVGTRVASLLVDEFWKKLALECVPEVQIILCAYRTEKWVVDKLFETSKIAEQCNKVIMTTVLETLTESTLRKLADKYGQDQDISSAAVFLKSVDIYFALLDKSSNQAISFVDAVDSGLIAKIQNLFEKQSSSGKGGGGLMSGRNSSISSVKKSIENIRSTYHRTQDSLWNGWIYSLSSDFPNSGLYEKYCSQIITGTAQSKKVRKKIDVCCPVDVLLYDSNNNLVAYVKAGKVYCSENSELTLIVRGDEKNIMFYDGADYYIECVGTDTGTMDVIVTEYNSVGEEARGVYFYDLSLQNGTVYRTDVDDQILNSSYTLSSGEETFDADLDTHTTQENKHTLTVMSGVAEINSGEVFSADLYAGQQINLKAYIPENCEFTGWTANVNNAVFGDATQKVTTLIMPTNDVVVSAAIAETGHTVIFDANGGTCDTVAIATDLYGKLDKLPTPTYMGYMFSGWFTNATDGSEITTDSTFDSNITVYAHWTKIKTPPTEHTHTWATAWSYDATHHWHECSTGECPITENINKSEYGKHTYDNENTAVCSTCEYKRAVTPSDPPRPTADEETYYISIPRFTGGEIIPSTRYAEPGERVTLTAHPFTGYELDTITVTDIRGRTLALKDLSNNSYIFTMPNNRVTVEAKFTKIQDSITPDTNTPVADEPFTGLGTPGISGIVLNPAPMPFTDVRAGDWYYDGVEYVWKHYLMSGVSDIEFSSNTTTSRAMIWTVLARMNNVRTEVNPGSNWYERGMLWAMEQGITDGSNPIGDITREQLATMIWRNAGSPSAAADLSQFSDNNTVSGYALGAVNWAVANGILNGSDGKLNPKSTATRAQVAAMVMRYSEHVGA